MVCKSERLNGRNHRTLKRQKNCTMPVDKKVMHDIKSKGKATLHPRYAN